MAISASGLLLCNLVYEDPVSHNVTLLGIFSSLRSTKFPTPFREISGYAMLRGEPAETGEVVLTCRSQPDGKQYARETRRAQLGPHGKRHVHIRIGPIRFSEPGEYLFSLTFDDVQIAEHEFLVIEGE